MKPIIEQKVKILAYQLGEKINIKNFKSEYKNDIYSSSLTDIFIKKGEDSYIYIQNYGEISFANCNEAIIKEYIDLLRYFVTRPTLIDREYKEDFLISVDSNSPLHFYYTSIQVPKIDADVIKIVMLNVSQSVVLDYFTQLSLDLLHDTNRITGELEQRGKLGISKIKLMKFIGKTLNTQNRIIDSLYFLDAPDTVWENEYLSKINTGLSKTFELKTRFREVEYTLKIIDHNLRTFAQLIQHRDSNKLEWIIIFLILFEVVHAIIGHYF